MRASDAADPGVCLSVPGLCKCWTTSFVPLCCCSLGYELVIDEFWCPCGIRITGHTRNSCVKKSNCPGLAVVLMWLTPLTSLQGTLWATGDTASSTSHSWTAGVTEASCTSAPRSSAPTSSSCPPAPSSLPSCCRSGRPPGPRCFPSDSCCVLEPSSDVSWAWLLVCQMCFHTGLFWSLSVSAADVCLRYPVCLLWLSKGYTAVLDNNSNCICCNLLWSWLKLLVQAVTASILAVFTEPQLVPS